MTEHTPTPWYVLDFRETEMKRLGWTGPSIDRILITNKLGPEIEGSSGADCVVARIQFDNREELLTENNRANADFICKAVNNHEALKARVKELEEVLRKAFDILPAARFAENVVNVTEISSHNKIVDKVIEIVRDTLCVKGDAHD